MLQIPIGPMMVSMLIICLLRSDLNYACVTFHKYAWFLCQVCDAVEAHGSFNDARMPAPVAHGRSFLCGTPPR